MVPLAGKSKRSAAATLDVAANPVRAAARATSIPASGPWARRSAKSTRARPAAASRQRAALVATVVGNVNRLSRIAICPAATRTSFGSARPAAIAANAPTEPRIGPPRPHQASSTAFLGCCLRRTSAPSPGMKTGALAGTP